MQFQRGIFLAEGQYGLRRPNVRALRHAGEKMRISLFDQRGDLFGQRGLQRDTFRRGFIIVSGQLFRSVPGERTDAVDEPHKRSELV